MTTRDLVVWGIPSCTTVKKARAYLDDNSADHRFADLRASSPSVEKVALWVETFGNKALRNTAGSSYRGLPAAKDSWTDAQWVDAFAADPMLIKRPVIEKDGVPVLVGFRPADLKRVLD